MKTKRLLIFAILMIFGSIIIGMTLDEYRYRFAVVISKDGTVFVPTGGSYEGLIDSLNRDTLLQRPIYFKMKARNMGLNSNLKPGRYELKKGMSTRTVVNTIRGGQQSPVRVTFNNIRTLDRLAGSVTKRLEVDSATMYKALLNDSIIKANEYIQETFIAMFIPNTYELYWTTTPEQFINKMRGEYEKFWSDREVKLSRTELSKTEVMTLASIVYEETKQKSEMSRMAGVYINRLNRKMPLQADPTVKFAMQDFTIKRVLNKYLTIDSPYNTYKYSGLTPGPICMPSIDAIDAVLDFEEHNYIYFCAKDDLSGTHNFATNLTDHNRNAQAYARALNRLKIK